MAYVNKHIINDEGRECACCNEFKKWARFAKNHAGKNGHSSRCRACQAAERLERKKGGATLLTSCDDTWDGRLAARFLSRPLGVNHA